jgi:hypothetical protein
VFALVKSRILLWMDPYRVRRNRSSSNGRWQPGVLQARRRSALLALSSIPSEATRSQILRCGFEYVNCGGKRRS